MKCPDCKVPMQKKKVFYGNVPDGNGFEQQCENEYYKCPKCGIEVDGDEDIEM